MEVKPIPKPRSIITDRPVPAPRKIPPLLSSAPSSSPSESSHSEKSDDIKSISERRNSNEFFRNLSTSSRQLREELSEKMTVKGRAVISSTKHVSIRLEKSVKNLLTRRLTSLNQDEIFCDTSANSKKTKNPIDEDRCVSMPTDDIFSSISFYSPLNNNLRSMKNEVDLSGTRHSPPPPVYPPPPLPDVSIYNELQSATSSSSGPYDTLSSTMSDKVKRDFPESFNLLSFAQNQENDSDQSSHLSDINVNLVEDKPGTCNPSLSRSDSWTFYDTAPSSRYEGIDELDKLSSTEEEILEKEVSIERTSISSDISLASIQNSLYENCPTRRSSDVKQPEIISSDTRQQNSKSLLFEFDPFAKTSDERVYGNYENNDLMLLETLLSNNDSPEEETELEEDDIVHPHITSMPPEPPKRFDSLPKNEYDEVEGIEQSEPSDRIITGKNPPVLPKLAHLAKRKQPAVPPRNPLIKINLDNSSVTHIPKANNVTTAVIDNVEEVASNPCSTSKCAEEHRKVSVIKKLKKLKQDSTTHAIKPNVISFVKSGSKLLHRNRDHAGNSESSTKSEKMKRPECKGLLHSSTHRGIVYRAGVGIERAKDLVTRAAVLTDKNIAFYTDKSMSTLKEMIQLDLINSIYLLQDAKMVDGETVHCIAISGECRPPVHIFYAKGNAERRIWAQRILENITFAFPTKYATEFTRAGWAYLKEGVTGIWFPAWLLLQRRMLVYTRHLDPVSLEYLDLRKARCIVLRDQEGPNPAMKNISVVVVDAGGRGALHIAAPESREGSAWRHALYQAAINCGPSLDQQQLTQDNVPVILDKCINFIYAHGIMSEGIYRRSGFSSAVVKLLESFRRDAWATQITRESYTEHDVATVLRRFLRDLSEPLFHSNIHDQFCCTSELVNENERITTYRNLLSSLNTVTSATLRRIFAHLYSLSQQSSRNLMTIENLSAIWGPTLMYSGETYAEEWNKAETKVICDLIRFYPKLYQLSNADMAKEAKMLEILERHHISNNSLRGAPSGDLKIWIYILSREGECVNVTIGPQKTASDVCHELAEKTTFAPHQLCLEECTLSGALERPLHHSERVLETVARWGYWDSEDRKDNILILKEDRLYNDIILLIKPPMTVAGELKFADTKSKHFKTYFFEFNQAKLCCYKDKVYSMKLYEWRIEDIVWYIGYESKRNPQMGWSITFINKNNKPTRCKDHPFFGNTLAGTSKDEQYRWLAAMLFGEYQLNLSTSVINLMDV